MELGQKEIDELIENCKKNNAGLHNVKGFEDKKPTVNLLEIMASQVDKEALIGGKDDW